MQKIAVIIPCYNEENRIDREQLEQLIDKTKVDVYFANDGSNDKTITVLQLFCDLHKDRTEIFDYKINEGKANTIYKSVHRLLEKDQYDYIGYLDADFSTPTSEFIRLINELESQVPAFIFGSRVLLLNADIKRKWQRHIIGRIIITIINLKFKLKIYDTQCGAKIFSKEVIIKGFSKPFCTSWLFDIEIFIRLKNQQLLSSGKEFPLNHWRDVEGSKLNWKAAIKIFKELYKLHRSY
jgi:dolichyl-phosphate beta-glucosyltransferase